MALELPQALTSLAVAVCLLVAAMLLRPLFVGLDEIVRDRTRALGESNRRLLETNRALLEARDAKDRFLASVSHELRTPLNSVIGFSGLMLDGLAGELNEEQRRQLRMVNDSGQLLLSVVNDILDLEKVEIGEMVLSPAPCDVVALVETTIAQFRPQAGARGLGLDLRVLDTPPQVIADEYRVRQILLNLLSNALKFTRLGSVSVEVSGTETGVRIVVADTGPGIRSEDRERIFEEFAQIDHPNGDRPMGTGLGLAVARRLAWLHGGDLTVSSDVGVGSSFTLDLPFEARMAPPVAWYDASS